MGDVVGSNNNFDSTVAVILSVNVVNPFTVFPENVITSPKLKLPLPFVFNAWPLLPSAVGKVNV